MGLLLFTLFIGAMLVLGIVTPLIIRNQEKQHQNKIDELNKLYKSELHNSNYLSNKIKQLENNIKENSERELQIQISSLQKEKRNLIDLLNETRNDHKLKLKKLEEDRIVLETEFNKLKNDLKLIVENPRAVELLTLALSKKD